MSQKLFADSNRASLREIIEPTDHWGETPTNGVSRARRFTTSSIVVTKDTAVSEEIRDDRMVSSVIETAAQSGGEVNWEFAAGSQDNDLQRVLMGTWTRPMAFDVFRGQQVSVTAPNTLEIAGDDVSAYFTVGRRVRTAGFELAANNDYAEISAVAFVDGVTRLTFTTATFEIEGGTAYTSVQDANDVIIRRSTSIRFGTTGKRTIDSNGTNAFAALVAAKQLIPGQRIFVEGAGYDKAALTVDAPVDGDTVTISDGSNLIVFEATNDADLALVTATAFAIGATPEETAANLVRAIGTVRNLGDLEISAKAVSATVSLTNLRKVGGSVDATGGFDVDTEFAGGNSTVGGFYTIVSLTGDVIVVDRPVPTLVQGTPITIKASMLRNPGKSSDIIPQSFSLETGFQDVGQFFDTDGLRAGNLNLEVTAGAIITGSTATMGRETKRFNAAKLSNPTAYTVLEAAATENVSATANVGALQSNGVVLSSAVQSIQIAIEGNLRAQQAVGSKFPIGISAGRLNITGTITVYFADGSMFDRFLNHETVSLAFPIIDPDQNTYWFTIPAFKVMSDPVAPGGTDQDVMEALEFTAFRDGATKCMMQIDRFSSVAPITAI